MDRRSAIALIAAKSQEATTRTTSSSHPSNLKCSRGRPRKSARSQIQARRSPRTSAVTAVPLYSGELLSTTHTYIPLTLSRYGDTFGGIDGMRIIKAGILDDVNIINATKPGAELFAPERISWVQQVAGEEGQVRKDNHQ